ncbi:uveal autoantigen with coiled-coil domains and ankyrin repeats-like [Gambusia affinis]|uniref:uveal autoantigen with coiled-coil domains and ankyrin repeats-like n=1 Tax=Gambusia affinis TaxID=33528 RepID=UPI001CDBBA85|nr:uveal autoantigen with coiled-coil domains and ankyrin repeats-like [Gambusia affinis]
MPRDELVTLLVDFLQRLKEKSAILIKEDILEQDLEKAQEQIDLLNEKVDSLTKELQISHRHNRYLNNEKIPKLKLEIETWTSHRNQLLAEVKSYQSKVKDLQNSLKNQERDYKLQIEKIVEEKRQVTSQFTAYRLKTEKNEHEIKRLEIELSKKVNEIGLKNNEIQKEKEKSKLLETSIRELEKKLIEEENENKNLTKKLAKTPRDEAIERTRIAFEARLDFDAFAKEKQRSRMFQELLTKKDRQLNELLEEQAKRRPSPSKVKTEAETEKKRFEPTAADWRQVKRDNVALNAEIKVHMENRQKDQQQIKQLTEQLSEVKREMLFKRIEQADLKKSINKKKEDIAVVRPDVENNMKAPTENSQIRYLPPVVSNLEPPKPKVSSNRRTLRLGEGKLLPDFKDNLTTQRKPQPPSQGKPGRPPFIAGGRTGWKI